MCKNLKDNPENITTPFLESFPETNTIPAGWDLSDLLSKPAPTSASKKELPSDTKKK